MNQSITKLFLLTIIFAALSFSFNILDLTLTPRFIVLSVGAAGFLFLLATKKGTVAIKWNIITLAYFFYTLFCVASISWAHTRSEAIFESAKCLLAFFVFCAGIFCLDKDTGLFKAGLYKISIVVVFIGAGMAIYQCSKITEFNKEALYAISSLNGHKNLYTSFLFLNMFFLFHGIKNTKGIIKTLSVVAMAISLVVIVFLKTKAVWIGLAAVLGVTAIAFLTSWIKVRRSFYMSLGICLVAGNIFFAFLAPRITNTIIGDNAAIGKNATAEEKAKELDNERLTLWKKTFSMIDKHPLAGVGMGNWQILFPDESLSGIWRAEDLNYTFQRPHNDQLWILSETGWIGFNLFLIFLFSTVIFLIRAIKTSSDNQDLQLEMIVALAFIIGFQVISFFDFPKERIEHLVWSNIMFAFAYRLIVQQSEIKDLSSISLKSNVFLIPALIMAMCVWVGVKRYQGEYHTRQMYNARSMNNDRLAIEQGNMALSLVYKIDPTSVPLKWYTGNSYINLKDVEKAKKDLIEALKANPFNRNVLNDLGSAYSVTNEDAMARKCYEEAIRISPRFDDPKLNLAVLCIKEKKWKEADALLKQMFHDSERRSQYQNMVEAFIRAEAGQ